MNGIDKIIGRISGDAQTEIDAILAHAREQAEQIAQRSRASQRPPTFWSVGGRMPRPAESGWPLWPSWSAGKPIWQPSRP